MRTEQLLCRDLDTRTIAARALERFSGTPDWIWVQFSAGYDTYALRRALVEAFPETALHGASSCLGSMTNDGASVGPGGAVGLLAFWDTEGDFGTVMVPFGEDPKQSAREAAIAAAEAAGRQGEAPDIIWVSAVPGCEESIIAGIEDFVGSETPIYGGSAADDDVSGHWSAFDSAGETRAGLVVSALFPSGTIGHAFQSGYAPAGPSATVTAAAGRRLEALDGRPARAVFDDWTGGQVVIGPPDTAASILASSTWSPLGRPDTMVADIPFFLLLHPAQAEADGAITLFADVAPGDRLHLMAGGPDGLTARAARTVTLAMEAGGISRNDLAGALVIFCGGSMLAMQSGMSEVARQVDTALGGSPFLGGFTFGEQGRTISGQNCHGNLMISAVVFARS